MSPRPHNIFKRAWISLRPMWSCRENNTIHPAIPRPVALTPVYNTTHCRVRLGFRVLDSLVFPCPWFSSLPQNKVLILIYFNPKTVFSAVYPDFQDSWGKAHIFCRIKGTPHLLSGHIAKNRKSIAHLVKAVGRAQQQQQQQQQQPQQQQQQNSEISVSRSGTSGEMILTFGILG